MKQKQCFHQLLCYYRNRPDFSTNHWLFGYSPRPVQVLYSSKSNVSYCQCVFELINELVIHFFAGPHSPFPQMMS